MRTWKDTRCGAEAEPRVSDGRESAPPGWVMVAVHGAHPEQHALLCRACSHELLHFLKPEIAQSA